MNKFICLVAGMLLPMSLIAQNVNISTPNTTMVLNAPNGGHLNFVYYGQKLNQSEEGQLLSSGLQQLNAYPAYGMDVQREAAISVKHSDGNMTLDLRVESRNTEQDGKCTIERIGLKDSYYPFYVDICYRTYPDKDIIETWAEYENKEKGIVVLNQFASAYLPIRYGKVWISHLYGTWANIKHRKGSFMIPLVLCMIAVLIIALGGDFGSAAIMIALFALIFIAVPSNKEEKVVNILKIIAVVGLLFSILFLKMGYKILPDKMLESGRFKYS